MEQLTKNQIVTAEITGLTHEGKGVCRVDNYVLFVPNTAVGDVCEVKIIKTLKAYGFGRVERIVTPSKDRIAPLCPVSAICGGCDFWHMTYEAECRAKEESVRQTIAKSLKDIPVKPIMAAKQYEKYRNKAQIPFVFDGSLVKSGFYREHSHDIVAVERCALCSDEANQAAEILRAFLQEERISIYDERFHKGLFRSLYVRTGESGAMVVLVCNGTSFPKSDRLAALLKEKIPHLQSLLLNINTQRTNVVLGDSYKTLWGKNYLEDSLLGNHYKISPASFYQVNKAQCEVLYSKAIACAELTGTERVLDLYCGIGTIGISMAKHCKEVVGVEIVPEAIEDAKENAKRNHIENMQFLCESAENLNSETLTGTFDVVILDPPRKGSDEKTLDLIVEIAPKKIVYVSCNPATLARDLAYLTEKGYKTKEVTPIDLFPRTSHVETVILMTRCGQNDK